MIHCCEVQSHGSEHDLFARSPSRKGRRLPARKRPRNGSSCCEAVRKMAFQITANCVQLFFFFLLYSKSTFPWICCKLACAAVAHWPLGSSCKYFWKASAVPGLAITEPSGLNSA